jgi:hypothetical protein
MVLLLLLLLLLSSFSGCWAANSCVKNLPLNNKTVLSTSDDCFLRVDLSSGGNIRLWTVELVAAVPIQAVVLDRHFVALQTIFSNSGESGMQETLCRTADSSQGGLETVFYLAVVGDRDVEFSVEVSLLGRSQLFLDVPVDDVISTRPHFFYFLLPNNGNGGLRS